jgi:hypothetical protein
LSPSGGLIEFYVRAHNEVMPHSAFQGQTPDEVFFGIGDEVPKRLAEARESAREIRNWSGGGFIGSILRQGERRIWAETTDSDLA